MISSNSCDWAFERIAESYDWMMREIGTSANPGSKWGGRGSNLHVLLSAAPRLRFDEEEDDHGSGWWWRWWRRWAVSIWVSGVSVVGCVAGWASSPGFSGRGPSWLVLMLLWRMRQTRSRIRMAGYGAAPLILIGNRHLISQGDASRLWRGRNAGTLLGSTEEASADFWAADGDWSPRGASDCFWVLPPLTPPFVPPLVPELLAPLVPPDPTLPFTANNGRGASIALSSFSILLGELLSVFWPLSPFRWPKGAGEDDPEGDNSELVLVLMTPASFKDFSSSRSESNPISESGSVAFSGFVLKSAEVVMVDMMAPVDPRILTWLSGSRRSVISRCLGGRRGCGRWACFTVCWNKCWCSCVRRWSHHIHRGRNGRFDRRWRSWCHIVRISWVVKINGRS